MDPGNLRVLVVAGDPLARGGLVALVSSRQGLEVVGDLGRQADIIGAAVSLRADAAVVDLGIEGVGSLRLEDLDSPVALADNDEQAAEALAAGALGALSRDGDGARLEAAIKAVVQGLVVIEDTFADALVRRSTVDPLDAELTPREAEALELLALGLSNREIAQELGISEHTAKFHVNGILAKLDARTRTEAAVKAARRGLLSL